MEQNPIKKNKNLLNIAKILRRNMTRQEKHLWYDFLRHYPVKVYKQRIIGEYIADFYCHQACLVIEIDGTHHYAAQGLSYDAERTAVMERYDLQVIRFTNRDIDDNFNRVCQIIDETIKGRMKSIPSHPTLSGALPEGEP